MYVYMCCMCVCVCACVCACLYDCVPVCVYPSSIRKILKVYGSYFVGYSNLAYYLPISTLSIHDYVQSKAVVSKFKHNLFYF